MKIKEFNYMKVEEKLNDCSKSKRIIRSMIYYCVSFIGIALVLITLLTSFKNANTNNDNMNSNNFIFSVLSKENDCNNSKYYNRYVTGFHVSLTNNSSSNIYNLSGDMKISLSNYTWEYSVTVSSNEGEIKSKTTSNFLITIIEKESAKALALYNASLNKLQIEFKLTGIDFVKNINDEFFKTYDETYTVIKPYGSIGGDTSIEEQEKINKEKYETAISLYNSGKYEEALKIFEEISFYEDSSQYIENCKKEIIEQKYQYALSLLNSEKYDEAIKIFEEISDYKDSKTQINECKYRKAKSLYDSNDLTNSYKIFKEIKTYKDSSTYLTNIENHIDDLANDYAIKGYYQKAIDMLKLIGYTESTSNLYKACSSAINGYYTDFVTLTNPTRVIVDSNLKYLPDKAFINCKNVTEIVLPNSLIEIGNYVFAGCSSLKSINLSDSITKIGNNAFEYCTSLTSFIVPNNLENLGSSILIGCSSLETISTKLSNKYYIQSFFTASPMPSNASSNISWPSKLSKIIITEGDVITKGFFSSLPNTIKEIEFNGNITEVKEGAFTNSKAGFFLPRSVKKINSSAYSGLGYLGDTITLHEGLEYIGSWAFSNSNFKTINIPSTVTYIGSCVFSTTNYNGDLEKINFNGTKEKWLSIVSSDWNRGMRNYYDVECSDAIYHHSLYSGERGWVNK